jgi:hypothetical protein
MAMTVEMSELLEHFHWLGDDEVARVMRGAGIPPASK